MPRTRKPLFDYLQDEISPGLHECLSASVPAESPEISERWRRYLIDRNPADFARLIEIYAPYVRFMVVHVRAVNPDVFTNHVASAISDGIIGLIEAIQHTRAFDAGEFRFKAGFAIRRAIWREFKSRTWGGRARAERQGTVDKIRDSLRMILEREPDRDEVIAELKLRTIHWKQYMPFVDAPSARMISLSDEPCPDLPILKLIADAKAVTPIDRLIEREAPVEPAGKSRALELALKGVHGIDRKIFNWMMQGIGPAEIARMIGLHPRACESRVNKLKWMARCNKNLAAYLGVKPDPELPPTRGGHWLKFDPPPAPLAA
ncbi:MAG: hypothetical protein ABSB42_00585 [Tepidisphaeraceae bacterium]|jgi:DNA-directed RNA polymerase specialized sigma subunit